MSSYYGLIEMLLVFGIVMAFATYAMISAIRQDREEKARDQDDLPPSSDPSDDAVDEK